MWMFKITVIILFTFISCSLLLDFFIPTEYWWCTLFPSQTTDARDMFCVRPLTQHSLFSPSCQMRPLSISCCFGCGLLLIPCPSLNFLRLFFSFLSLGLLLLFCTDFGLDLVPCYLSQLHSPWACLCSLGSWSPFCCQWNCLTAWSAEIII